MASTSQCPYCGSVIRSDEERCPNCGAANRLFVVDTPRTVHLPRTIQELQEYCAERGMPLLRMRFFIGEDYREPKAFGIYRDGRDVVVYKNKADGSRAIRYRGPDEEYAVNELFQKLLSECHNRGIYPDGRPVSRSNGTDKSIFQQMGPDFRTNLGIVLKANKWQFPKILLTLFLLILLIIIVSSCAAKHSHQDDGYYSNGNGTVYYHYGNDWYYTHDDTDAGFWYKADSFPENDYSDYSLGESWDEDWGVSDFKQSSTWDDITSSSSDSSSDSSYDSWDSGGTDWDSDW